MKNITIYKRKGYIASLLAVTMLLGTFGCKKGTFDINGTNPNSPQTVPPSVAISAALSGTANLIYSGVGGVGGNQDILNNWMGYWTQSGGFTPSNTYVLYQLTSGTGSGNWDVAYNNLSNYHAMLATVNTPALANYKAVGMIMTAFVYQRIVDLYGKAPYTTALVPNAQFSYKYDDGAVIYKAITAQVDSAVAIIAANPSAQSIGSADVMFGGDMSLWTKFANTLKLKILMRQTQQSANGSLGDAGVKSALTGYTTADFLGTGEDAIINPGYSNAADAQVNPLYYDVVANSTGGGGVNSTYYRANSFAVGFYQSHNDPRDSSFYYPNKAGVIKGRAYGSIDGTEANSVISGISAFGRNAAGTAYNTPSVGSPIIPACESLFLQAEAVQRGYITGSTAIELFDAGITASFTLVGVKNAAVAAKTYYSQADKFTNLADATNPIETIITQKWSALNGIDALESYSDYRRLGYPTLLPISIYPGVTVSHIPYRFPYPTSELNFNAANVPDGGTATEALTSKIFWMP